VEAISTVTALATGITTDQLFEEALASSEPLWELRGVVRGLLADGHAREAVLADFEQFRLVLQAAHRESDEEIVLEVMDFVAGWCSPHMRL
jgi:hypothetical protein